jgi:hypothetical protein
MKFEVGGGLQRSCENGIPALSVCPGSGTFTSAQISSFIVKQWLLSYPQKALQGLSHQMYPQGGYTGLGACPMWDFF